MQCPKCSHNSLEVTQNGTRFRAVCTRSECGFQSEFGSDSELVREFVATKEAAAKIWGRHVEEAHEEADDEYPTYHGVLGTIARARAQEELSSGTTVFFPLTDPMSPAVFQYGQGDLVGFELAREDRQEPPPFQEVLCRLADYRRDVTTLLAVIQLPDGDGETTREPLAKVFRREELTLAWWEWRLLQLICEVSKKWPPEEVQSDWSWRQVTGDFQLHLMAEDSRSPLWMLSREDTQARLSSLQARGLLDENFRLTFQAYFALRVGFVTDNSFAAEEE